MKKICIYLAFVATCLLLFTGLAEAECLSRNQRIFYEFITGPIMFCIWIFTIMCGFGAIWFASLKYKKGVEFGGWVKTAIALILLGVLGAAPTVLSLLGLYEPIHLY